MTKLSFCTLNCRSIIELSGPDVIDFLQNLITNDITAASQTRAIYAALLTPQGKILFDFFITQPQSGVFWLECSREQSADVVRRLSFYRLRADVTINPLAEEFRVTCIWGENAGVLLNEAGAGALLNGFAYADPRTEKAGLRLITNSGQIDIENCEEVAFNAYEAHRIRLGLADSDADIGSSQRFAHECNMDMTGGVDFSKGCYVGQEVVSRMHHKQAARKRILPISSPLELVTGTPLMVDEKSIGEVLSTSGTAALVVLRLDKADKAIMANSPITVKDATIALEKPEWAKFPFPGETT